MIGKVLGKLAALLFAVGCQERVVHGVVGDVEVVVALGVADAVNDGRHLGGGCFSDISTVLAFLLVEAALLDADDHATAQL